MKDKELVNALREHAEWQRGNEWETPITLGDDLVEAADRIANQNTNILALQREIEGLRSQNEQLREASALLAKESAKLLERRWIPVEERLPENAEAVLVRGYAVNSPKYKATFKGRWIAAHSMLADDFGADSDMDLEYDEAEDEYYVPEGWFERIENWDDYTDIAVCDFTITHWMPLPETPEEVE